jgi:hypothetical protein
MHSETAYRRVHVLVPTELLSDLDAVVGERRRSQFIVEAVTTELRRRRLKQAIAEMAGSLADVDIPGWETQESAAAWVRALRDGTLGTQEEDRSGDDASTSEPVIEPDVSSSVTELTEIAFQLSQSQVSAIIEHAREELAQNILAGSGRSPL